MHNVVGHFDGQNFHGHFKTDMPPGWKDGGQADVRNVVKLSTFSRVMRHFNGHTTADVSYYR